MLPSTRLAAKLARVRHPSAAAVLARLGVKPGDVLAVDGDRVTVCRSVAEAEREFETQKHEREACRASRRKPIDRPQ